MSGGKRYGTFLYKGEYKTIPAIARLAGCTLNTAYRFLNRYGSFENFDKRRELYPRRYTFENDRLTMRQIADRLNTSYTAIRKYIRRHGTIDGYRERKQTNWLEPCYHTLNLKNPIDSAIASKGYRSIRQFCLDNGIHYGTVSCWRNGKPFDDGRLENELISQGTPSKTLSQLMEATGCLEYELFPKVFTVDFYRKALNTLHHKRLSIPSVSLPIELKEARRILISVVNTLKPIERDCLVRCFDLDGKGIATLTDIAHSNGHSVSWQTFVFRTALAKLRHPSRIRPLADVFGRSLRDREVNNKQLL